jgi:hypothetical protein
MRWSASAAAFALSLLLASVPAAAQQRSGGPGGIRGSHGGSPGWHGGSGGQGGSGWHGGSGSWHGGHGGYYGGHYGGHHTYYGGWYGGWGWYGPGVVVGWPYYYPYYWGSPWWYGAPGPYSYPSASVVVQPQVYVERAPAPPAPRSENTYWYYCQSAGGYYPKVPSCPEPWVPVPPNAE